MKYLFLLFLYLILLLSCNSSSNETGQEEIVSNKENDTTRPDPIKRIVESTKNNEHLDYQVKLLTFFYLVIFEQKIRKEDSITYSVRNQKSLKLRACLEGTMYDNEIFFSHDNTFDLLHFSFHNFLHHYGTYIQKADTMILTYKSNKAIYSRFIQLDESTLIPVNQEDSILSIYKYYVGKCKNEN